MGRRSFRCVCQLLALRSFFSTPVLLPSHEVVLSGIMSKVWAASPEPHGLPWNQQLDLARNLSLCMSRLLDNDEFDMSDLVESCVGVTPILLLRKDDLPSVSPFGPPLLRAAVEDFDCTIDRYAVFNAVFLSFIYSLSVYSTTQNNDILALYSVLFETIILAEQDLSSHAVLSLCLFLNSPYELLRQLANGAPKLAQMLPLGGLADIYEKLLTVCANSTFLNGMVVKACCMSKANDFPLWVRVVDELCEYIIAHEIVGVAFEQWVKLLPSLQVLLWICDESHPYNEHHNLKAMVDHLFVSCFFRYLYFLALIFHTCRQSVPLKFILYMQGVSYWASSKNGRKIEFTRR